MKVIILNSGKEIKLAIFIISGLGTIMWQNIISVSFLILLLVLFILDDIRNSFFVSNTIQMNKLRILYILRIMEKMFLIFLVISLNTSIFVYFAKPKYQTINILVSLWLTFGFLVTIPFFILRGKWNLENQVPIGL